MSVNEKLFKIVNNKAFMAIFFGWLMTGFSQLYNRQYFKALLFLIPNFINNQLGHLNEAILYSFYGEIDKSQALLDFQWILYYPAFFTASHCDGYREGYKKQYLSSMPTSHYLPFILSGMCSTVGIIIGAKHVPGPIFLGLCGYFLGGILGIILIKKSNDY